MARTLGRYHIISELGRGGMGVVYKALDPKLERFIAIKCLSDELSSDEIVVARFLREARNVAALNHPNIAQVFVADEHEGKPYFVMEYVDGESLADFIAREGQCSPEMARRVTEQSAEALAAAAEENIVHRDVKPGNIMLDRRGRAVLTDFGIACVAADPDGSERNATLMGTPGYLPPEALTGGQPDCRGDLFSLGLVYYEMLTGRRLVVDTDLKAMLATYMQPGFPDLSALDGKVDERVVTIIARLLALKPEERYADSRQLLDDMAPLKTGHTGPIERSDSGPTTAETAATAALKQSSATVAMAGTKEIGATSPTENLPTGSGQSPSTVPVERDPAGSRGRRFALLGVLVASLVMIALGVARMDDGHWERLTGLFSDSEQAVADIDRQPADFHEPGDPAVPDEAGVEIASAEPSQSSSGTAGSADSLLAGQAQLIEAPAAIAEMDGEEFAVAEERESTPVQAPAEAEAAPLTVPDDTAPESRMELASVAPAPPAEPEPPTGVAVVGVGDPVIADPMAHEIERALRGARPPLVDKRFIGNFGQYVDGEEIDLAGLAGPAAEAGVRYLVVAWALPAGSRELQFYNRHETAWIVQLEARTFDLHLGREIGASPLEQIEYTSLNATERARRSVQPWLPGLREQFDRL
jgi:eukaryotic-like serine/threonine-protein kinase